MNSEVQVGYRCLRTIAATQLTLSRARQQALFRNGAQAATSFLIRWAQAGSIPGGASPAGIAAAQSAL